MYETRIETKVVASIGDLGGEFDSQEEANTWLTEVQTRLAWMEQVGLLALVNGPDKRWGANGLEHLGCERGGNSLYLSVQRALNYIGKWITFHDITDDPDEFPLDLTGKIVDEREVELVPVKTVPSNAIVPRTWKRTGDSYEVRPLLLAARLTEFWRPVIEAGAAKETSD